jgi:hypothetical protein
MLSRIFGINYNGQSSKDQADSYATLINSIIALSFAAFFPRIQPY